MSVLGNILREARGERSIPAMASRLGIHKNTLGMYERGQRVPDVDFLAAFSARTGVSFALLLSQRLRDTRDASIMAVLDSLGAVIEGEDAGLFDTDAGDRPGGDQPPTPTLPVLGLAECGLKGWYQEGALAVRAARPGDLHDRDAFAVIAIGESMRPAGIWPGHLCLCSPLDRYDVGDAVYVLKHDGTASIKLFGGHDRGWIILSGYLPPGEDGAQTPYVERLRSNQVHRIATVIYVKRKL